MADFSDDEDKLLYRLAKAQVDEGRKISWRKVWLGMRFCGKSQRQLQIRLKTLKRTYGVSLDGFPRRFTRNQDTQIASKGKAYAHLLHDPNDDQLNVPDVLSTLFKCVSRHKFQSPDCHAGEITADGVSAVLKTLPALTPDDIFVDVGSGIGNVIAQVVLETLVKKCIGAIKYSRLSDIAVYRADVRAMDENVQTELGCATILYANNLVFDPTSNLALEEFAMGSHSLVHLIFTKNVCGRHLHRHRQAILQQQPQTSTSAAVLLRWRGGTDNWTIVETMINITNGSKTNFDTKTEFETYLKSYFCSIMSTSSTVASLTPDLVRHPRGDYFPRYGSRAHC
ncbi:hypothetical protein DVH05_023692 [Phytophthora capsici]|nr:hypothetical protein DVH05_023692 [Phytophthora capsici]